MIFETQDGSHSIFSEQYGVSYHSKYGAVQESQHVFLDAGLHLKAILKKELSILEIGFGSGLNAFMTYLTAKQHHLQINYVGVDIHPISLEIAKTLNYPQILEVAEKSSFFQKMHESTWDKPHQLTDSFCLEKRLQNFHQLNYHNQFDIIYFDAFAPSTQPDLWEATMFQKMYDALLPDGVLTTYCAKGSVKRALKSVGFEIEALKGPPGKREMTRAKK